MPERSLASPLLELENVTAGYADTEVLTDVSLAVDDGEVVGLVGRNGVGKTTTLRTIMGNVIPRSGTVTFDGADVTTDGPVATARRGIAFVPEERRIFHDLSVRENLELSQLGGGSEGITRSIDDVLSAFENLGEREDAPGRALSGGEQQMLAIARALVGNARLLLLDEPTEGLAPLIVQRVSDIVDDLNMEGVTILLVEQNVRMALDTCEYLYLLDTGRIVHEATADDLEANRDILDRHLGVTL